MSIIFSHALNAIKNNAGEAPPKKKSNSNLISKTADSSKSILSRIKKTQEFHPNPREILRKKGGQTNNLFRIAHKLIKKTRQPIVLKRVSSNNDKNKVWVHDLYDGPGVSVNSQYHRVFIRNLSDIVDSDILKKNIHENLRENVLGIKVVNFLYC